MMITLGLDPHPASHTIAALDANGASLASLTVPNTAAGLAQLHQFALSFPTHRWAIEGAGNHFIAPFVNQLLEKGERVYSIPPSLTSQYRARRGRKKNDVVDAENVARALLANPQGASLHSPQQQREWQELTRAQRRLSEQLKANRGALQELMAESPVRESLQQVHCHSPGTVRSPRKADSGCREHCDAVLTGSSRSGSDCGWHYTSRNGRSPTLCQSPSLCQLWWGGPGRARQWAKPSDADQPRWQPSAQLGTSHCGDGPITNGWWSIEAVAGQTTKTREDQALGSPIAQNLYRS